MVTAPRLGRFAVVFLLLAASAACKEQNTGVKVAGFSFTGVHAITEKQLKTVLATQGSSKLPWGTKHYFSREQFEADLKRIVAFYQDRGFPDARVKSFDVKLSPDQNSVKIRIDVNEGEPVRAEQVNLTGFEPLPDRHRHDLTARMPLKTGQPLDRALLQASREAALDELKDHGYPYAKVRVDETPGSSERQRIITLVADTGPLTRYGAVEITGNSHVGDNVVRRQLTFKPGQIFQQSKVIESQRRLYALEVFSFANVAPLQSAQAERATEVPTRVTLTEGKHKKVNFGLGYGSEERARAEVDWRHVNFFGGARTAGVFARYSSLDRGLRLNFKQPYFFTQRYTLELSAENWHNDEPAFKLDTRGGRMTITRQFRRSGRSVLGARPSTTLGFNYANEWENYSIANATLTDLTQRDELIALGLDPRTGTGRGQLSAISLDAGQDTTGNILDARRGYFASAHLEQAGRWLRGDYDYIELTSEERYYLSLGSRAVLAVRARLGSIDAFGRNANALAVPFFKRYFLGGATNLRGWGRFEVSPLSGSGLTIGGQSTLNFSTEIRAPIRGNLGAVLFLDGGNVWTNPWDFNVNDLRYDVGPGIRYKTPIGPLRVDLGYQLNPIPGLLVNGKEQQRRFRFHFSIGQAF